jgi:hypothetical protein
MPEQEQQQEVGEEQRYSRTKQSPTEDVVEIMAVVRDDHQSTSLVHSPKARRAGYARQLATVGTARDNDQQNTSLVNLPKARRAGYGRQLATVGTKSPSRSPNRKRIKLVIPRSRNELDQVHHSKATSDVHILDVVHHNRRSSIFALKELKHHGNGTSAECPEFYSL